MGIAQPGVAEFSDADAFADAVRPHLPKLGRVASRLGPPGVKEDVVQEALARAWAHRAQFDPGRGPLLPWLLTIVANEARRARRRKTFLPISLSVAVRPVASENRLDMEAATAKLPDRQRLAVNCFYYIGLSTIETAAVMGCSEGTVKSSLNAARQNLRAELEKAR